MGCKNCKSELQQKDNFCRACGAKIIKERITIKGLFSNLLETLGWDSNFFVTLRHLLYKPQIVFEKYIDGTRKRYAAPFTFFAIILAVSLFVFSQYSEQFIQMSTNPGLQAEITSSDKAKDTKNFKIFGYKNQDEFREGIMKLQMQYYNLTSFLLLPLYTLIAFLVFGKPHNFGEHLVINTYLQGILTFLSILLFLLSLLTGINIFGSGIFILPLFYYPYAYKKLNGLTFGQTLMKILKFMGILLVLLIFLFVIGVVIAIVSRILK